MTSLFKFKKFKRNRRGVSSIVGAIFMIIIIWIIASSYFFFTLSQNTAYNTAVKAVSQESIDRISESITVISANYTINANDNVTINAQLQNTGPAAVEFVTIWAYANNNTWANYNYINFSLSIRGGETLSPFSATVPVSGVKLGNDYDVTSWLITTRGNTISLPEEQALTNNIIVAKVSEGIGSVAFDFEQFYHYAFSSMPAEGTVLPSASPNNYTLSESKYNVLHVTVTNYDLFEDTIVLDGNSSIYIVGEHSGTVKWGKFVLVNVEGGRIYPTSAISVTLEFGESVDLYFAATIAGLDTNSVYPLNILLYGTKGDNQYGQNIPFTSVYWAP
jgi:FlaG/FlaF family flagellin (archaellin)